MVAREVGAQVEEARGAGRVAGRELYAECGAELLLGERHQCEVDAGCFALAGNLVRCRQLQCVLGWMRLRLKEARVQIDPIVFLAVVTVVVVVVVVFRDG